MYTKTILNNGLRVISHKMADRGSLAIGVWINAGGRYEDSGNKGISHFLEHMLFKGSHRFSCRQIKESIEGVGGSLNGFTSEELTCYLAKIPAKHVTVAANVLMDMVLNPLLSPKDISKERTVILEEMKMYRDLPQSYVYELLDELMWPNQPLGQPIIGTDKSVNAISKSGLAGFKAGYYTASNMVISAAGNINHKQLVDLCAKIFGSQKAKAKKDFLKAAEHKNGPATRIFTKDTEQTHLALGYHAFNRQHPLRHAQGILHIVLGANMSSRLFNELREKRGLAYEIGTSLKRFADTGAFLVHAGIDNRKVRQALNLIITELERVTTGLIAEDEFRRAKDFYLGQLMLSLEDTMDHMLWIGETTATLDRTYSLADIVREVNKATRDDIRNAARQIFNRANLSIALIGPIKESEALI